MSEYQRAEILLEMRMLCRQGEVAQALDLSEVLYNVPDYIAHPEKWNADYFISEFNRYEELHPKEARIPSHDYLDYLSRAANLGGPQ